MRHLLVSICLLALSSCIYHSTGYDGPSSSRDLSAAPPPGPYRIMMIRHGVLDELHDILVARGHTVHRPAQMGADGMNGYDVVVTLDERKRDRPVQPSFGYLLRYYMTLYSLGIIPFIESRDLQHKINVLAPRRRKKVNITTSLDKLSFEGLFPSLFSLVLPQESQYMRANLKLQLKVVALIEDMAGGLEIDE